MKIRVLVLFGFFALLIFACDKSKSLQLSETNPQIQNQQKLKSKFDRPILEVISNFWGLTPMNGKILDIRLFEDGIVEYDSYPTETTTQVNSEDVKVTKQTKISDQQMRDLIDFLTSDEFLNTKDRYTKKNCISYDADRDFEIKFRYKNTKKRIEVIGYCDVLPDQITRLMEKIEKITNQRPS